MKKLLFALIVLSACSSRPSGQMTAGTATSGTGEVRVGSTVPEYQKKISAMTARRDAYLEHCAGKFDSPCTQPEADSLAATLNAAYRAFNAFKEKENKPNRDALDAALLAADEALNKVGV